MLRYNNNLSRIFIPELIKRNVTQSLYKSNASGQYPREEKKFGILVYKVSVKFH